MGIAFFLVVLPHLSASPRQSFFMKMIAVWVKIGSVFLPHSNINVSVLFKHFGWKKKAEYEVWITDWLYKSKFKKSSRKYLKIKSSYNLYFYALSL